jgi:hypothetical protein
MAIRAKNIKNGSDLKKFTHNVGIDATASTAEIEYFITPFKCSLRNVTLAVTAAVSQSKFTITNVTRSATLVDAATAAGLAANGSVGSYDFAGDFVNTAGSLIEFKITATAMVGYASITFEKLGGKND